MTPDLSDLVTLAGLAMLGVGLWLFAPALALSVVGAIVLAAGVLGSR